MIGTCPDVKKGQLLRCTVLQNDEIILLKSLDETTLLVGHHDVQGDGVDVYREAVRRFLPPGGSPRRWARWACWACWKCRARVTKRAAEEEKEGAEPHDVDALAACERHHCYYCNSGSSQLTVPVAEFLTRGGRRSG